MSLHGLLDKKYCSLSYTGTGTGLTDRVTAHPHILFSFSSLMWDPLGLIISPISLSLYLLSVIENIVVQCIRG